MPDSRQPDIMILGTRKEINFFFFVRLFTGPKRSKMALTGLAPTVPGSLRGRQRQSQYSGGSKKVENGLNWFGTDGSWTSARVSKTVADRFNVLGRVKKGRKWP